MDSACFNYSIKVITIQDSFAPHCCHCSSVTQSCLNLCNPMECSTPGLPVPPTSGSLPKFMSTASVMPSSHLILCHPPLLLPSIFPSIKDFSKESSVCIRWAKYWSFSFSISPSNEYSWLISLKINWFDLLAVQETFRSLLQHNSSNSSILWLPALTTVCDHWENYSLDYMDLCWQSNVSAFQHTV